MSSYLKSGLLFLVLCTVAFLLFVNIVENNVGNVDTVLHNCDESSSNVSSFIGKENKNNNNSSGKLLDFEDFAYVIRPPCRSTFLTWIVTSYAGDAAPRSALRRAYTNQELVELGIKRVFLLGLLDDAAQRKTGVVQAALHNEAERFQDIVQGNFYEAYRNLTYKHLMGLKWASESCNDSRFIVKQDDDIVVNLYEILEKIKGLRNRKELLAGYVLKNMKPVREPANKWFVKENEFRGDSYPHFLSGWLYVVDRDSAGQIVRESNNYGKYFWIDDVFLTGIIRHELNIALTDWHDIYTTDYRYLTCCIKGQAKQLKCEIAVGPNGGNNDLQVDFRKFAEYCQTKCRRRLKKFSVTKTCVVEYEEARTRNGSAKVEPIKFL